MKKYVIPFLLAAALAACGGDDKKAEPVVEQVPQGPLGKSKNSEAFNVSFKILLSDYYALKNQFIAEDSVKVDAAAKKLMASADSLQLKELKADSGLVQTAKSYVDAVSGDLKAVLAAKNLTGKRRAFSNASENFYNLARVVQYDREIIYHQHCPMAFEDNQPDAYWLSNSANIKNPYLPKKMLECGDVPDSLDYRPKP
jgi:hypothetical protein